MPIRRILTMATMALLAASPALAREKWDEFGRFEFGSSVSKDQSGVKGWTCNTAAEGSDCRFSDESGMRYASFGDEDQGGLYFKALDVSNDHHDNLPFGMDYQASGEANLAAVTARIGQALDCHGYMDEHDYVPGVPAAPVPVSRSTPVVCDTVVIPAAGPDDSNTWLIVIFDAGRRVKQIRLYYLPL